MRFFAALLSVTLALPTAAALDWEMALQGEHRSESNSSRDAYRRPRETLEFLGLREGMTVVELAPGGGWYTEVLAPLLKGNGAYYAAHYDPNGGAYYRRSLGAYLSKLGRNDGVYGNVVVTTLAPPDAVVIAPEGRADLVLAFRNIHSWMNADGLGQTFAAAFAALKPGGMFGVVQHRASDGRDVEAMKDSGYVSEDYVIAAARSVGFELDGRSEVNANPTDPTDHAGGVWALPPTLRGEEGEREAKLAIGESDRMTLRFIKPGD